MPFVKKTIRCTIIFGNYVDVHLSQIIAGYQLLKESGLLKFTLEFNPNYISKKYIHNAIIEVNFNDGVKICYDLSDGYQSFLDMNKFDTILNDLDFYFKRSSNPEINKTLINKNKIKQLGFNYPVSCLNNPFDKFYYKSSNALENLKKYINYLRYEKQQKKLIYFEKFENKPNEISENYKILYSVRLWDHEQITLEHIQKGFPNLSISKTKELQEKWQTDWKNISLERIEQIRALKDNFSDKFIGGVSRSNYSEKIASDIIAPYSLVNKNNYLNLIKSDFVCIANRGVYNSIGWKFGEYVAASRAIITEPLLYDVSGNFSENNNYLTFNSTQNLLKNVDLLINNPQKIHAIEKNNFDYYNKYLKPDQLVLRSLEIAGIIRN